MGLTLIIGFGITWVDMKFQRARQILTPLKQIMLNSVITWLALLVGLVVFLVVLMRWNVHCAYLYIPSIAGNFTNNAFRIFLHTLWTLLAHDV